MRIIELVLIGHPDKVCDGISEEVKKLNHNGHGRNAIESVWFNDEITVGGETDKKWQDYEVRALATKYLTEQIYLDRYELESLTIRNKINTQSPEIDKIVGKAGAGDNGIFYGGWDTTYSPVIFKLKAVCKALNGAVLQNIGYRTDGKLIAEINEIGAIERLTINIASKNPQPDKLEDLIREECELRRIKIRDIIINPKGDWQKCFGFADSGLTGRKLACDTQCALWHNGGGAWFGKDYSKADYSIPIFLTFFAKQLCERWNIDSVELNAYSIIGDTEIKIYNGKELQDTISYKAIMDFVATKKIDIFGGCEDLER